MLKANGFLQYRQGFSILLLFLRGDFIKILKRWLSFLFFLVVFMASMPSILHAHDNIEVHPYIAEQVFYVWPNDPLHEIHNYLGESDRFEDCGYLDGTLYQACCHSALIGTSITEGAKEEDDYDPVSLTCVNDLSSLLYG